MTDRTMTPDELEVERTALLAAIDAGEPLTAALRDRIVALAAADAARPPDPVGLALRILLDEAAAQTDRDPRPGLRVSSLSADPIVVLTADGAVYTTVPRETLLDLAERIRAARH